MDNAQALVTRDTFTLFPKLPPELRIKVWGFALPEPRVVEIDGWRIDKWPYISKRSRKAPSLLQVNAESRSLAMISYKLSFGNVDGGPTYFDFEKDTLYLRSFLPKWLSSPLNEDFTKVQNLAIWFDLYSHVAYLEHRLEHFKNLKNVTVNTDKYIRVPDGSTFETISAVIEVHKRQTQENFDRLWAAFQERLAKREEGEVLNIPKGFLKPSEDFVLVDSQNFRRYVRLSD
jgi:hypothetical protein